jgi:hypothetical protein
LKAVKTIIASALKLIPLAWIIAGFPKGKINQNLFSGYYSQSYQPIYSRLMGYSESED